MGLRAVAIDMDGTLLGSAGVVSERNLAALRAAAEAGVQVVIATGRRHSYAMKVLRGLDLPESTMLISSNGTVTRALDARLVRRSELPRASAVWLCDHLREYRNALVFTFDRVGADGEDVRGALVVEQLEHLHGSIGAWMTANDPYIEQTDSMEEHLLRCTDAPIQAMLCGTMARMRQAEERLLEHEHVFMHGHSAEERIHTARVAIHRTEYPARDLAIVDLLPGQCSKGAALQDLCADLEIKTCDLLAIGDNWNDLPMFEVAGTCVVMANAPAELKARARSAGWEIGRGHDEDGVAAAIEARL